MKRVEENGQMNKKLIADSVEKEKTKREVQQDLQKVEIIERKQKLVEKTAVRKKYHNFNENLMNKIIERKMTRNKIT